MGLPGESLRQAVKVRRETERLLAPYYGDVMISTEIVQVCQFVQRETPDMADEAASVVGNRLSFDDMFVFRPAPTFHRSGFARCRASASES
jgi:hypothetical protein